MFYVLKCVFRVNNVTELKRCPLFAVVIIYKAIRVKSLQAKGILGIISEAAIYGNRLRATNTALVLMLIILFKRCVGF